MDKVELRLLPERRIAYEEALVMSTGQFISSRGFHIVSISSLVLDRSPPKY
jgi:hypothetical protein